MGVLPKEVIREIIKENNVQHPQEIMKFMKDSFKDILQEMLEDVSGIEEREDSS